jgi:hypothetical protein
VTIVEILCTHVNWKVRHVETILGIGGIKKNDGEVKSTMIYFKNLCKCYNVALVQQ